jgi:GTPase SAR1 family protein
MCADEVDYAGRVQSWLRRCGRAEQADTVKQHAAHRRDGKPSVFVVGEDKRGKSTLVNALLGDPDASPTGVEVVTGAPISFVYSSRPRAVVSRYGSKDGVEMEVEDARRLATIAANPGNVENIRSVRIGLPVPLLSDVTIVDTPGVGGLESGHAALTMQSLRRADALIFVAEAGAQFRSAELEFLSKATERVDTVILALTKIDRHRGWRTIQADNQRILAEQAPRFANSDTVPLSSLLALQALTCDDPEDAAMMREESGIPVLTELLRSRVTERIEVARQENLVRLALSEVLAAERRLRDQLPTSDPAQLQDQLAREKARLATLRESRADWPSQLDAELRRLTLERTESANSELADIRHRYENRLRGAKKGDFETMPGELIADLTALDGILNEDASERIRAFLTELLADLDGATALQESMSSLADSRLSDELSVMSFGEYRLSTTDKMSILTMFNRGTSVASLLSGSSLGLTAGTFLAPPFGLLLGFGIGGVFAVQAFRGRNQTAFGQEFRSWMQEQISQAQLTINSGFARALIDVQSGIKKMIRTALTEREAEVSESLDAVKKLIATDARERQAMITKVQRELDEATQLKEEAARLFVALAGTGRAPGSAAPVVAAGSVEAQA